MSQNLSNFELINQKITLKYGLVSVNIKPQKYHLKMNPACSACLCVNEWHRHAVVFTTHILKHVMLAVISLNEDINT